MGFGAQKEEEKVEQRMEPMELIIQLERRYENIKESYKGQAVVYSKKTIQFFKKISFNFMAGKMSHMLAIIMPASHYQNTKDLLKIGF